MELDEEELEATRKLNKNKYIDINQLKADARHFKTLQRIIECEIEHEQRCQNNCQPRHREKHEYTIDALRSLLSKQRIELWELEED